MSLLTIPLILGASYLVAFVVASLIVEGADALGLCYSIAREERREPEPVRLLRPVDADLRAAMHAEAMRPRTVSRTPIADRLEALEREYATVN